LTCDAAATAAGRTTKQQLLHVGLDVNIMPGALSSIPCRQQVCGGAVLAMSFRQAPETRQAFQC
jgi:hypothetical protein